MSPTLFLDEPRGPKPSAARRRKKASAFTLVGLVLLAFGLGSLGWVAYQYFGTDVVSERAFKQEKSDLRSQWEAPAPKSEDDTVDGLAKKTAIPGEGIALMRIPKFGADYEIPVLAGTDLKTLSRGIGHYDNTALPGELGNFAVAGHRITHGQPFERLLELKKGDEVIVETRELVFTYVLDTSPADLTVKDTQTWVIDPNPADPGKDPTQQLLTLTTCQDLFHSPDRSIGFGHLASTRNKG